MPFFLIPPQIESDECQLCGLKRHILLNNTEYLLVSPNELTLVQFSAYGSFRH